MPNPQIYTQLNIVQRVLRHLLETEGVENGSILGYAESVLGAGGRAFKSPRPDQLIQIDAAKLPRTRRSTVDDFVAVEFLMAP